MDVRVAVAERRSVRGFLDRPVDIERLRALAVLASRAPSGGNLQPWHVDIVAGPALDRLRALIAGKIAAGAYEAADYAIYPSELPEPYRTRRFRIGEALYATMGIAREDKDARMAEFRANFRLWDAPAALFCTVDRRMGPPQWSDLGMYLQSFMLLAVEEGLAVCAQEAWALWGPSVRAFLGTPDERLLFCGMAIGYEDTARPANTLRSERADPDEWLRVHA